MMALALLLITLVLLLSVTLGGEFVARAETRM